MVSIKGKYGFDSQDNVDEFLKAVGKNVARLTFSDSNVYRYNFKYYNISTNEHNEHTSNYQFRL